MGRPADAMLRVASTIQGPFRGLAGHVPAEQISPVRMADADNCWIERGVIRKRSGFQRLEHSTTYPLGWEDWEFVSLAYYGSRHWNSATSIYDWAEMLVAKVYEYSGTPKEVTSAKIVAIAKKINLSTMDWELVFDECLSKTLYTYSSMSDDGAWHPLNILPFTTADLSGHKLTGCLLLDGNENTRKLIMPHNTSPFQKRAGLPACVSGDATLTSGESALDYPAGTFEFAITFCNRLEVESLDPIKPPGVESNYYILGELTTNGTSDEVLLRFDYPTDSDVQEITHVRVYRRDVAAGESWWRAVGYFATAGGYQEDGDGLTEGTGTGGFDDELHLPGPRQGDASDYLYELEASGQGPYDWAPSRNYEPSGFDYGVIHNNRGFFAARDKHEIWFTDPINPLSGGHLEHITPEPLRAPLGPITMLASYHDALVVGTPNTLYVVRGTLASLTNAGVARGEIVTDPGIIFDETEATIGPVRDGSGSHVIAENKLWFITREGLAYFDGDRVVVVARPIRDLMLADETYFTANPERHFSEVERTPFRRSVLCHDKERACIYMNVHEYGDWSGPPTYAITGAWTCRGSIWCYAYLETDPEPNRDAEGQGLLGSWTPFKSIGGSSASGGESDPITRQITAMTIAQREDQTRRGQLAAGIVTWNASDETYEAAGAWMQNHDGDLYDASNTTTTPPPQVIFEMFALMGSWDDGMPDRRKKLLSAYAFVEEDAEDSGGIRVYLNGNLYGAPYVYAGVPTDGLVRIRIGAACRRAQVYLFNNTKYQVPFLGYGFDRKLLGQIR